METQPLIHQQRRVRPLHWLDDVVDRFPGAAMVAFAIVNGLLFGFASATLAGDMALGGETWFNAATTGRWALAAAIAGIVVVPAVSGFVARTWAWLLMAGSVTFAAVVLGAAIGLIAARLAYPRDWANRSPNDFLPSSAAGILAFWGVIGGFCLAAGATYNAAIGTALGKLRNDGAAPKPTRDWSMALLAAVLILIEWFLVGRHL